MDIHEIKNDTILANAKVGVQEQKMKDFEIKIPWMDEHQNNVTDLSLYNYNFNSYSLSPMQEVAGKSIAEQVRDLVLKNVSNIDLVTKKATKGKKEIVADVTNDIKSKLESGELEFLVSRKDGKTLPTFRNAKTKKFAGTVRLSEKEVKDLGNLSELSSMQAQLADISEQIENLNHNIQRVEQGQYNDRFAGFFSARQMVNEGLAALDSAVRKDLLLSAVKLNNDTIAKLMLAVHLDSQELTNEKTSKKDATRINQLLQQSIGYLNSSVQLNLIVFTQMAETNSLMATLTNYKSFVDQVLLLENEDHNTVAWLLDNGSKGDEGMVEEVTESISGKIKHVIDDYTGKNIEGEKHEELEE